jgi:hypothetical protein
MGKVHNRNLLHLHSSALKERLSLSPLSLPPSLLPACKEGVENRENWLYLHNILSDTFPQTQQQPQFFFLFNSRILQNSKCEERKLLAHTWAFHTPPLTSRWSEEWEEETCLFLRYNGGKAERVFFSLLLFTGLHNYIGGGESVEEKVLGVCFWWERQSRKRTRGSA